MQAEFVYFQIHQRRLLTSQRLVDWSMGKTEYCFRKSYGVVCRMEFVLYRFMHDVMSFSFSITKLVSCAPFIIYWTSHVPLMSVSVDLWSISNRFIEFWKDDKMPRFKFITQLGSSSSGQSSSMIPSWYVNLYYGKFKVYCTLFEKISCFQMRNICSTSNHIFEYPPQNRLIGCASYHMEHIHR